MSFTERIRLATLHDESLKLAVDALTIDETLRIRNFTSLECEWEWFATLSEIPGCTS